MFSPGHSRVLAALLLVSVASFEYVTPQITTDATTYSLSSNLPLYGYNGKIMFGFSGNQFKNSEYITNLNRVPALKNEFFPIGDSGFDQPSLVDDFVTQTRSEVKNALMMLTLEPFGGLNTLTTTTYNKIAAKSLSWSKNGIKMYLRFAHEMNGDWYVWGRKPIAYKAAFRALALAIKNAHTNAGVTSLTRMVWAPAVAYKPENDAPYLDYYPGSNVVDWVGLSLYHFADPDPTPGLFIEKLTTGGDQNFYQMFCVNRGKQLMIAETSAPTPIGTDITKELAHKKAWWTQIYALDTATKYPMLRMIVWFEFTKYNKYYGMFTTPSVGKSVRTFANLGVTIATSTVKHLVFAGDA